MTEPKKFVTGTYTEKEKQGQILSQNSEVISTLTKILNKKVASASILINNCKA